MDNTNILKIKQSSLNSAYYGVRMRVGGVAVSVLMCGGVRQLLETVEDYSMIEIEVSNPIEYQLLSKFNEIKLVKYHESLNIKELIKKIKYINIADNVNYENIDFTNILVKCSVEKLEQLIQRSNTITHVCTVLHSDKKLGYYEYFIPLLNNLEYLNIETCVLDHLTLFENHKIRKIDLTFVPWDKEFGYSIKSGREVVNLGLFESIYFKGNYLDTPKSTKLNENNYVTKCVVPLKNDPELNRLLERNKLVHEQTRFARTKAIIH